MQKVPVLRVVPQSCPKMPRRKALIKTLKAKGNVHGFHLYTSVLIKQTIVKISNLLTQGVIEKLFKLCYKWL
jgi:hypothetical protein